MARLRNVETGAVVNVPDEKVANLVGYVDAAAKAEPVKAAPAKPAAK